MPSFLALRSIFTMNRRSISLRRSHHIRDGQTATAWLFCAPALLSVFLFYLIPFCLSIAYSFTNKMLVPRIGRSTEFVGVGNYLKIFSNDIAAKAFVNTGLYALMVVPAIMVIGTILAVFVNRQVKGVKTFRAIYFSPQVVTMTVVAVVWSFIFSPGESGLLNSFLGLIGIPPQSWLQNSNQALFCIAVMYIWQSLGLQMIIILGGLQYIPEELYEAGRLDGCSIVQKFLYITVPLLKNTLVYVLISTTINTLKLFTQVYVLTNGGPNHSTTSVVYLLYKAGFINSQLGYSSAIAVVFFLIVLIISLIQNYAMSEK
ncbi:binding-protein-dependent transport systems inner membrane component [Sediminispirochaeta smaragdinae DSM 11293]|uniref:Binding-protein-dependent transport systems inner membrane component n=2 Tax=Sediminispirochaeta TaxID=1911556 RepID=E1R7L6_SEDSS|nr:binding-protein-dependent transport systems inner membrane component [Sediminispirochaeta smaragdinae DSM 11293]